MALGQRERDIHMKRIEHGAFYRQSPPERLCIKLEQLYSHATGLCVGIPNSVCKRVLLYWKSKLTTTFFTTGTAGVNEGEFRWSA